MDLNISPELEDLVKCGCCHLPFNDNDAVPKIFDCRHYFCLKCVNSMLRSGNGISSDSGSIKSKTLFVYCIHCWKRTEIHEGDTGGENLPTHKAILYLSKHLDGPTTNMRDGEYAINARGKNIPENYKSISERARSDSLISLNSIGGHHNHNNNPNNTSEHANNLGCNGFERHNPDENCLIHAMPNTLWCNTCNAVLCRGCAAGEEHRSHIVKNQTEAKEFIQGEIAQELQHMHKSMEEMQHLMVKQRNFLLKILECCGALKTQIEAELSHQGPQVEMAELQDLMGKFQLCLEMLDEQTPKEALSLYASVQSEKFRLAVKQREFMLQYKLNEGMRNCGYLFDYDILKQILMQLSNYGHQACGDLVTLAMDQKSSIKQEPNGLLLLTNYCVTQMYSRHIRLRKQQQQQQQESLPNKQLPPQRLHVPYSATEPPKRNCSVVANSLLQAMISNVNMPPGFNGHTAHHYNGASITSSNNIHNNNNNNNNNSNSSSSSSNSSSGSLNRTITSYAQALLQNQSTNQQPPQQQQQSQNEPSTSHTQLLNQSKLYSGYPDLIAPINTLLGGGATPATTTAPSSPTLSINLLNQITTTTATTTTTNTTNSYFYNASNNNNTINGLAYTLNQLQQQQQQQNSSTLLMNPNLHVYPIYYFNIEINGQAAGRILIEVRSDVAPKMAKNFNALTTHEVGFGYKGCQIFQCWENESIITGDFEHNNGRGGRSVYDEGYFMPDDTKILAVRGAVGMRRSQRRHDNLGLVGSQFRIILREMRCFTGIFAFVIEGLDLVDKISQTGDTSGKPKSNVVVVSCGKYQVN